MNVSAQLMQEFEQTEKTLGLPFDRGGAREEAIRSFLKNNLPRRYGVSKGFVVSYKGEQSAQCDVIIYDAETSPIFYSDIDQEIFPVESVYGVIEVKSRMTMADLEKAIENIKSFKQVSRKDVTSVPVGGSQGIAIQFDGVLNMKIGGLIAYSLGKEFENKDKAQIEKDIVEKIKAEQLLHQIDFVCIVDKGIILPVNQRQEDNMNMIAFFDENTPMCLIGDSKNSVGLLFVALIYILNNTQLEQPNLFEYFNQN